MQSLIHRKSELLATKEAMSFSGPSAWFMVSKIDEELKRIDKEMKSALAVPQSKNAASQMREVETPRVFQVVHVSVEVRNRCAREALEEVDYLKRQKQYQESTIHRLQNDKQPFRVADLIAKAKKRIEEIERQVIAAEEEAQKIKDGERDEQILAEMRANSDAAQKKGSKTAQKKAKTAPPEHTQKRFRPNIEERRAPSNYEVDREFRYFMSNFERFPKNLLNDLKKMPANRGFVGRDGSYYYGLLPEIEPKETVILTEKFNLSDGNFEIKEYVFTPTENIVYRRTTTYHRGRRTNHREEVSRVQRARINTGF